MVTQIKNNTQNMSFIELDFQKFAGKQTHSTDEVRNVLESRIAKIIELPEDMGDDREAKEAFLRKRKADMAYKNAIREMEIFDQNQELYTTLFSLKEATNAETYTETNPETGAIQESEKNHSKICEDQNGNLFLAVEVMKPCSVSFQIHDGKLAFDPAGMTPDQLKEIISYLDHRGLGSYIDLDALKLENTDQKTEELFTETKNDLKEEMRDGDDQVIRSQEDSLIVGEDTPESQPAPEEENSSENNEIPFNTSIPIKNADRNTAPADAYDNAVASLTKWMDKNKRRNLSYFVTYKKGYTVFTAFEKENPENLEQDGVIDKKTGDVKAKNECKLYVKMNSNGRLEISFSMPNGKPLTDCYADRIMDAYKDAGISRVKFGTMSDANEGSIRAACGRGLIVPVGLKLSQTKFDKMIDAAEGKNGKNNPKVIKYRRDLALQLAYQLQQKGIQWDHPENKNNAECRCVRFAIGAYEYSPFRDLWEDFGLRAKYESVLAANGSGNPNGAATAIGTAKAVSKLYAAYSEGISEKNPDGSLGFLVSDQCTTLTEKEKEQFKNAIQGIENTSLRDIPPQKAIQLFEIMQKTQEERAAKKIEEEYKRLVKDEFYKGNAARDAVSPYLEEATIEIDNVKNYLSDIGLPPIVVARIGKPKYDFSHIQSQVKEEKQSSAQHDHKESGERTSQRDNAPRTASDAHQESHKGTARNTGNNNNDTLSKLRKRIVNTY